MDFIIRMGIPEMKERWNHLVAGHKCGTLSKGEEQLYQKWGKAMRLLSLNPLHPSLHSHEIPPLSNRYGQKVWQSYLENRTSTAKRMYWVYGPGRGEITVIGLEPHPEDAKNGGYDKVTLSETGEII